MQFKQQSSLGYKGRMKNVTKIIMQAIHSVNQIKDHSHNYISRIKFQEHGNFNFPCIQNLCSGFS